MPMTGPCCGLASWSVASDYWGTRRAPTAGLGVLCPAASGRVDTLKEALEAMQLTVFRLMHNEMRRRCCVEHRRASNQ